MMNKYIPTPFIGLLYADKINSADLELSELSRRVRVDALRLAYWTQTHHISPAFSCIDLLVGLYFKFLNIRINDDHDYFILSKGHAALAFYIVLTFRGLIPASHLRKYCNYGSCLGQHPTANPAFGIEVSSGSLGLGLSIGAGCAFGIKQKQSKSRSVVLVGDGELNEGSMWEAIAFAGHHRLKNLILIIDRNSFQCLGTTRSILNLEPLKEKLKAFKWEVVSVSGHNHDDFLKVLSEYSNQTHKPLAIIANTIKGYGVSFMEDSFEWHHKIMTFEEFKKALKELKENYNENCIT